MRIIVEPGLALNYLRLDANITQGLLAMTPDIYVISLRTFVQQWPRVCDMLDLGGRAVIEKTDESVITQWHIASSPHYITRMNTGQICWITDGDAPETVANLNTEHFLAATIGSQPYGIPLLNYQPHTRPYKFLFTNRKVRPHRRYLIHRLHQEGLLDKSLWCNHEEHTTWGHPDFNVNYTSASLPTQSLPSGYDPDQLPNWIDGVIVPAQYLDTWFTLVSETVFESPASFRTEKFYKPVLAGHPFLVCANYGFYRDLHNLGFRSFNHLIDESFDVIINGKDRMDRLIDTAKWLCQQDLAEFWNAAKEVCLYNQHRALELHNSQHHSFTQQLKEFMNA